ncbi:MAG TPA: orotidine-5'-phosphate decarboxylase [Candidatus Dormibacteraeota bacterium]
MTYFERLRAAARARRSQLCVGLDPDPDRIDGNALDALRFCQRVIEQTSDHVCCYKPNAAYWAQYGVDGFRALTEIRLSIPEDIPLLLDFKVADIGNTMKAYARAAFEALDADAVTVHAYHGADSLEEYTAAYPDRGVYIVCRTSNPGGADLQDLDAGGRPLYLAVAELAERVNQQGNVGLVVGATAPTEVAEVRAASDLPFLLPGVGPQGGDLEGAVRAAWTGDEASCLVSVSRAVLYAEDPDAEAHKLKQAINSVLAAV